MIYIYIYISSLEDKQHLVLLVTGSHDLGQNIQSMTTLTSTTTATARRPLFPNIPDTILSGAFLRWTARRLTKYSKVNLARSLSAHVGDVDGKLYSNIWCQLHKKNTWQSFHTTRILESTRVDTHTKLRFWDAFSFHLPLVDNDLFDWTQESPAITLQYVARNSEDAVRIIIEINNFKLWSMNMYNVQSYPLLHIITPTAHEICFILLRSMWHFDICL